MGKPVRVLPVAIVASVLVLGGAAWYFTRPQPAPARLPAPAPKLADPQVDKVSQRAAERKLEDALREGSVRAQNSLNTMVDTRREAVAQQARAQGELKEALTESLNLLDDAGASLSAIATKIPTPADIKVDFARADEERLRRVKEAENAFLSLKESFGIVNSLAEDHPELVVLKRLLALSIEDARLTLDGYHGQVPL
ncbi:MAG: hypothetical protein ACK5XS_07165 [Armatimonadota bacterium]|nr:hypothetical protein [Fimbriimonadaceae bacterium]MCZ8137699.1 hypothetical protein [Fimbriimonadaceae bacterium]